MLHLWRVFAVYRLARLIAVDDGPFDVCFKLRLKLGAYDQDMQGRAKTNLGRGVSCPHCIGVYVAVLVYLLPAWAEPVIAILGLAGAQSFLQSISGE